MLSALKLLFCLHEIPDFCRAPDRLGSTKNMFNSLFCVRKMKGGKTDEMNVGTKISDSLSHNKICVFLPQLKENICHKNRPYINVSN